MKKGFTLIELLATLIVLTIIALIAVPTVLRTIEDSKIKTAIVSASNYVKAVNYKISQEEMKGTPIVIDAEDNVYVIGENELEVDTVYAENITGEYILDAVDGVTWAGLCVKNYPIVYINGKASYDKTADYCSGESTKFEEPEATLLSEVCKDQSLYSESKFKAYKADDLACFSNLVESGKNFNGKTIYLLRDIDFSDTKSYDRPNTTDYGDINGNGTVEGLYTELTTGRGFKPIGNNNKPFRGTFLGYAFKISNLMINRTTSYVGLFGVNNGTISGVKLRNANIKGADYVGGVLGYNNNVVKNLDVTGTIVATGNYAAGPIGGNHYTAASATNLLFSGSVVSNNNAGGITAYGPANGVVYNSTVGVTTTSNNKYIGKANGYVYGGSFIVSNVTLAYTGSRDSSVSDGTNVAEINLLSVDGILDTYIGGDNDNDGYYFDYSKDGGIELYSAARTEIKSNKLKGSGTQDSPYIIKNTEDWRRATATVTQGKYYIVTKDLDFNGKNYYPMGTGTNKFNGRINGNMHYIKNISTSGYSNTGLFGYNTGTIEGFRFDNISLSSTGNYIGIVAYNTGIVKGLSGTNITVSSAGDYAGGGVGHSTNLVKDIKIKGNITTTGSYAGGAIGSNHYTGATANNLLFSGTVTSSNNAGGVIGFGPANGVVYDSIVKVTTTSSNRYIGKANGYVYGGTFKVKNVSLVYTAPRESSTSDGTAIEVLTLPAIDGVLDTYMGGDNDNDGYYFDYDNTGDIEVYSTSITPIENTLKGSGTQSDPYLISTPLEWKMAATMTTSGKYFSVTADIDFAGGGYYQLGTSSNKFAGYINGNMHTLSNINVSGYDYIGVFGYNTGTIEGFKFNNVTINALGSYAGIVAYNTGIVKGISGTNITVSSAGDYVGGAIGYSTNNVKDIKIKGDITTTGNYAGGVVGGNHYTGASATNLLFSGTVTSSNNAGGVIGYGPANGVVYDSTVKVTTTSNTKYIGKANGYVYGGTFKVKNVTLVYTGSRETSTSDGTLIEVLTLPAIDGVLDTYMGGDNDNDGYYFDYDGAGGIDVYSTAKTPIVNSLRGSGTQSDPYLISTPLEWKMAATMPTSGKYFSVTADIDFSAGAYYQLGTSSNKFAGYINGNMHTLSNINVSGYDYIGVFGYNTGTIEGFRFNNVTINALGDYAGIVAYNTGIVKGISGTNITVTSKGDYVGGAIGYSTNNVKDIKIKGNITTTANYAGGVMGGNHYTGASATNLLFSGTVKSSNNAGGITANGPANGVVYDSTVTITTTSSYKYIGKANGYVYGGTFKVKDVSLVYTAPRETATSDGTLIEELTLPAIDGVLDTYIGGDNDLDGYYFDYDGTGDIELYSTSTTPITNTLSGDGSQANPYLIKNVSDWRMATATLGSTSKYYSITNDIDFSNSRWYAMGTSTNKFNGRINGNMHTLSNINASGYDYIGVFGYNTGTIEGLRFNNVTINALGSYAGIVAYNTGTVKGIRGTNITVNSSSDYAGGAIGYSTNLVREIDIKGNITTTGNYAGGVMGGNHYTGATANNLLFSGTVTSSNNAGGITANGPANGVVYDSTVKITTTSSYKYIGKANGYVYGGTFKVKNVSLVYTAPRETATSDGTEISELTIANVSNILDTTDSDSDSYYFGISDGELMLLHSN